MGPMRAVEGAEDLLLQLENIGMCKLSEGEVEQGFWVREVRHSGQLCGA